MCKKKFGQLEYINNQHSTKTKFVEGRSKIKPPLTVRAYFLSDFKILIISIVFWRH